MAPYYLSSLFLKSEEGLSPINRLKAVLTMVISTLYLTVKPTKSYNPILGETFEGFMTQDYTELKQHSDDE